MDLSVPLSARPGLKKSASMQEDLDSAIRLIRKPNRGQAVKAFVEASEERSKPGLNGRERTRISDGMINRKIQIAATPSKPRAVPADAGVLPRVSRMNNVVTSTPPRPPLLESIACRNSASSLRESTDMDANERVNGRTKTVMCTPAKRRDHEGGFHQSLTVAATTRIAATPAKGDGRSNGEDVGPAGERTIYEQLGWDTVDELA